MLLLTSASRVLKSAAKSFFAHIPVGAQIAPLPYLIHFHIFKNAGSSIDRILASSFGAAFGHYETTIPFQALNPEGLGPFLASNPVLQAVSSHLPRRFLLLPHCLPIVMLRHPIDRARSVHQFICRDLTAKDNLVARQGFAAYVDWALGTPGEGISIRNYQVFHLSGSPLRSDNPLLISTVNDLLQAQARIAEWPAFGLVRHFRQSCHFFQTEYAPIFPQLRFREIRENVSPETAETEEDSVAAARDELGPTIFAKLCAANELDDELYRFARALFTARASQT